MDSPQTAESSTAYIPRNRIISQFMAENYGLCIAVMIIFIVMMGMLMYCTTRCWYPEDFGVNRNRTRRSSISTVTTASQDKPPTYYEIQTNDNMKDPPTYNEALQRFAELQHLPDEERIGYFHTLPPTYRTPTIISHIQTTVTVPSYSDG